MQQPNVRQPSVAGQFYPATGQAIKKQLESFIDKKAAKRDVITCMLPHAGYMYSGKVAAHTVSQITVKDTVILLGPNHTGCGEPFSIMTEGIWQTPLGEITIDAALAKKILKGSRHLKSDSLAHQGEHSLEVELPILQYFKPDFEIVPIAFLTDDFEALKETGKEIASVITQAGIKGKVLIIASSDMTHYEPQAAAEKKDRAAIEAILRLDEDALVESISRLNISMCGYAPVIAMLAASKALGATKGELSKYQTSGDVTGDKTSVVGYAGVIIY